MMFPQKKLAWSNRRRKPKTRCDVTSRFVMIARMERRDKGSLHPSRVGGPFSARLAFFSQKRERYVESDISLSVGVKFATRVFDQNSRPARDPVNASGVPRSVQLKADVVADVDVESRTGLFTGGDQVMKSPFMGEDAPGKGVKILGAAVGAAPAQKLRKMQEFVLEDPLQRLESVAADQAANGHRALDVLERVVKQRRRDRDLVVNLGDGSAVLLDATNLPDGLACGADQPAR
jgi:hypothetical protein